MSLWAFIPLCMFVTVAGGFILGCVGAALSNSEGFITSMMLLGLVAPPVTLIYRRSKSRPTVREPISPSAAVPTAEAEEPIPAPAPKAPTSPPVATNPGDITTKKILVFAGFCGIVLFAWFSSSSQDNLGLEVIADRGPTAFAKGVSILNASSTPITILDISVNGRDDCYHRSPELKKTLKQGDRDGFLTHCEVLRLDVKTDRGTATFSFK